MLHFIFFAHTYVKQLFHIHCALVCEIIPIFCILFVWNIHFQLKIGCRQKYRQLYVPQTVYSHNMTSWRAREARMYHWPCLILLKLSELTKHNRSNLVTIYTSNNMIYTIVLSITYKLSPSPHIRMWKKYFTYTINFRIISHTCMCK